jgi:hypothetical protein
MRDGTLRVIVLISSRLLKEDRFIAEAETSTLA